MYVNPFQLSLETMIGAAPLLGHALEERAGVRQAQDWQLVQHWQSRTSTRLRCASQQDLFCIAPLDILVTEENGRKKFHLIEVNGTGIGGLTNLSGHAVGAALDGLCQMAQRLPEDDALVLVASSGKEMADAPRLNKLIHEKVLYAEALKRGFEYSGRTASVHALPHLATAGLQRNGGPAIVLGYMKDILDHLTLGDDSRLFLLGRSVHAAVNDRFCLNVLHRFDHQVDLGQWWTMNRGFLAGADKGVAYRLFNDFQARTPHECFAERVHFARAKDRDELVDTVLAWVRRGRKAVIKPQGTGLGHGIRFFLSGGERTDDVIARIDESVRETEAYYNLKGGAFPYTVCEYLDTCTIQREHPLRGHKFEIRIAVYRDGDALKAFPSITKIASERYDAACPAQMALINNITASAQSKKTAGTEFMLPLSRRDTLDLLGLSVADIEQVCAASTRFVRFLLDSVEDRPEVFGLPARMAQPALA